MLVSRVTLRERCCFCMLSIVLGSPLAFSALVDKAAENDCRCWAVQGQCEGNPKFMRSRCAASCAWHQERETTPEKIAALSSQISTLTSELDAAKVKGDAAESAHRELAQARELLQFDHEVALQNISALSAEIAAYRSQIEQAESQKLGQDATSKNDTIEDFIVEVGQLQDRILQLESQLKEKDDLLFASSQLREELEAAEHQLKLTLDESERNSSRISTLVVEVELLKGKLANAQQEIQAAEEKARSQENAIREPKVCEPQAQLSVLDMHTKESSVISPQIAGLETMAYYQNMSNDTLLDFRQDAHQEVDSASEQVVQLNALVIHWRNVANSTAAAEVAAQAQVHALEERIQALELQLQRDSRIDVNASSDTDAWAQLYEFILQMPDGACQLMQDVPSILSNSTAMLLQQGKEFSAEVSIQLVKFSREFLMRRSVALAQWIDEVIASCREILQDGSILNGSLTAAANKLFGGSMTWCTSAYKAISHAWSTLTFDLNASAKHTLFGVSFLILLAFVQMFRSRHAFSQKRQQQHESIVAHCRDPLANSRLRRRESQEDRTLQILKLQQQQVESRKPLDASPSRSKQRPPPLTHLVDADSSDNEDEEGIGAYANPKESKSSAKLTCCCFTIMLVALFAFLCTVLVIHSTEHENPFWKRYLDPLLPQAHQVAIIVQSLPSKAIDALQSITCVAHLRLAACVHAFDGFISPYLLEAHGFTRRSGISISSASLLSIFCVVPLVLVVMVCRFNTSKPTHLHSEGKQKQAVMATSSIDAQPEITPEPSPSAENETHSLPAEKHLRLAEGLDATPIDHGTHKLPQRLLAAGFDTEPISMERERNTASSAKLPRRILAAGFDAEPTPLAENNTRTNGSAALPRMQPAELEKEVEPPELVRNLHVLTPGDVSMHSDHIADQTSNDTSVKKMVEQIETKLRKPSESSDDADCPVFDMARDDDETEIEAERSKEDNEDYDQADSLMDFEKLMHVEQAENETTHPTLRGAKIVGVMMYVLICAALAKVSLSSSHDLVTIEQPFDEMHNAWAIGQTLLNLDQVILARTILLEFWADPCNRVASACIGGALIAYMARHLITTARGLWGLLCFFSVASLVYMGLMLEDPFKSLSCEALLNNHRIRNSILAYTAALKQSFNDAAENVERGGAMIAHGQPRVEYVLWEAMSNSLMSTIWNAFTGFPFRVAAGCVGLILTAFSLKSCSSFFSQRKLSAFSAASPSSPLGTFQC